MGKAWAKLGIDLHLEPAGPRLRQGLTEALREAVRSGRLAPGTRLPSSRTLAADLGIARNTVADAYAELVAEGHLTARQGAGTRVADVVRPTGRTVRAGGSRLPRLTRAGLPHNLLPGTPDLGSFPRAEWLRAARKAVTAAPNDAFGYGDPHGRIELRAALAEYLARARGVDADPDRIVVCGGSGHGVSLLAEVLRRRGVGDIAVESYGLYVHRDRLVRAGLRTLPLPFDADGTDPGPLGTTVRAGAALLTPTHQFPMGVALRPDRRAAVVDWARGTGGLVLDDDYDGEFRYDRHPVGALQGLAPDRVVHLGTVSKSLGPGLRLGWMVLPAALVGEVLAVKGEIDSSSALDELTLAEFIASGAYDRHVRGMRQRYRRRRDQLVAALTERAPAVRVRGIAAGLHAIVQLPDGTEQTVVEAAAWHGLAVQGLSFFRHPDAGPVNGLPSLDALVVGYGTPAEHAWSGALEALCRAVP